MKKIVISLFGIAFSLMIFQTLSRSQYAHSNSSGGPQGNSGDPKGGNNNCTGCHSGSAAATVADWISSDIPSSGYVPGTTYAITATASEQGRSKFGFQISPQNSSGVVLGTLINKSAQTKLVGSNNYITHTASGLSGTDSKTWTFDWTAPQAGSGAVTFYGAFNASNNANNTSGDKIYLSTLQVQEALFLGLSENVISPNEFKLFPNPANSDFSVQLYLEHAGTVQIRIFDQAGKMQELILEENQPAGAFRASFDIGGRFSPGVYFVHAEANGRAYTQRLLVY
jgi:hypothetical protein